MGTVYLRGRVWWIKFYRPSGECVRRSAKTTSKRRAELLLSEEVARAYASAPSRGTKTPPRLTVAVALEEWIRLTTPERGPSWKTTIRLSRRLVTWLGSKSLADITPHDLTRYGRERSAQVKGQSAFREMTAFGSFLKWCVGQGWIDRNAMRDATKPSAKTGKREGLSIDAVKQLIETAKRHKDPRWYPIILMAYCNAICRGEMTRLRWENVDFENQTITIEKGKTAARRATIGIHPTLLEWLKANKKESGPIICQLDSHGRPTTKGITLVAIEDMQRRWKADAVENGAATFPGLHVGRNTLATFLVQQRVPIERVSKILRHASIATTARYYAHLSPLDCRDDLTKFPI